MSDTDSDTSLHARRMAAGDRTSLLYIVERFTPMLMAQASYRLGATARGICEPGDLVNDVWATALPRIGGLNLEGHSAAQVLARYLSATLLNIFRNALRARIRRRLVPDAEIGRLPDPTTGIVTGRIRAEHRSRLEESLAFLAPQDREIVILRAFEGASPGEVAAILGLLPNTVSVRYRRALDRLRGSLGPSVLDDLVGGD